jgi:hypothetical protein
MKLNNITITEVLAHFKEVKDRGNGQYSALCPAHKDTNPSLSITHKGGDVLFHCHTGCKYRDILSAVGLWREPQNKWKLICEYLYTPNLKKVKLLNPDGKKVYIWKHRSESNNDWEKGASGQFIPLYNESVLAVARHDNIVYLVEGEKDVDTLTAHGKIAVCSPHGATKDKPKGKWNPAYNQLFKGCKVVIIQDNDEVGIACAQAIALELYDTAASIRIVDLTCEWADLKDCGDVTDVFKMNGNDPNVFNILDELAECTAEFEPDNKQLQESPTTEQKSYRGFEIISAHDLQKAVLPPVKYLVDGLLAVGTSMITAASKIGKSWFVLDMGLKIAAGGMFMEKQTNQCGVLYLSLEDTKARLQERMNKLLNGKPAPSSLYFATNAPSLDNGLLDILDNHIKNFPDTNLIIIDTLQKIRGKGSPQGGMYQQDYREMGEVKEFMDKKQISVLFVHHNRKLIDKDDPFNMISGTTGIMGAADTIFVITKKSRNESKATLHITGRDVEQSSTVIRFRKSKCKWEIVGDEFQLEKQRKLQEYQNNPVVKTIKSLLSESPTKSWCGFSKGLLAAGEKIMELPIAETAQKLGFELKKLGDSLREYDEIIYNTIPNGNAGQKHSFHYELKAVPVEDYVSDADDEDDPEF